MSGFDLHYYLWATGNTATQVSRENLIQNRYRTITPHIWQDTQPHLLPSAPEEFPESIIPYLILFPYRLHIPVVYGICELEAGKVTLLENAPIDRFGNLYPTLEESWAEASPIRQVYWLWQILKLWTPLQQQGVTASLLVAENLRVEGWRLRLRELYTAQDSVSLASLGDSWGNLARSAKSPVASKLTAIIEQLQGEEATLKDICNQLNSLLLEQATEQSLRIKVASGTDVGIQPDHNEDSCYPTSADFLTNGIETPDFLSQHLAIICDGIGGHEGGEIASQLAVQSLKLQVQALLTEIGEESELMSPDLVADQLRAIIRVVNNLIANRNDAQGRESRQRMATTLVMALQLPQKLATGNADFSNSHELYIAHVGDSRAYWLTPYACQLLTVDQDVVAREVRMARNLYREALKRPDAGGITQALGTRNSESLRPNVQRFIIEEDGLLLLCSDGLSDNNLIEETWQDFAPQVIQGKMSLERAVELLIEQANQKNGHDNISVILTSYGVSPQYPVLVNLSEMPNFRLVNEIELQPQEMINASAIIPVSVSEEKSSDGEEREVEASQEDKEKTSGVKFFAIALGLILFILVAGTAGLIAQQWLFPQVDNLPPPPSPPELEEDL